jgi:two-component system phosphate regulon response regulator PhoB
MKPNILLVEDDAALGGALRSTWHFRKEGFDVVQTGDGEEALIIGARSARTWSCSTG